MITIQNYPISGVMKSATILVFDGVNRWPLTLTMIWTMPFAQSNIHAICEIVISLPDIVAISLNPSQLINCSYVHQNKVIQLLNYDLLICILQK